MNEIVVVVSVAMVLLVAFFVFAYGARRYDQGYQKGLQLGKIEGIGMAQVVHIANVKTSMQMWYGTGREDGFPGLPLEDLETENDDEPHT